MAAKDSLQQDCALSVGGYLSRAVTCMYNEWRMSPIPDTPLPHMLTFTSPLGTIMSGSCKFPAPQTHLGKQPLQSTANFQIHMPAMEYNLARYPIKLPAQCLYLMTMPRFVQRPQRKRPPYIICQYANAKSTALAPNSPQGILSIPKPIFSSLIRFSLHSPRWLHHSTTSCADSSRLVATPCTSHMPPPHQTACLDTAGR